MVFTLSFEVSYLKRSGKRKRKKKKMFTSQSEPFDGTTIRGYYEYTIFMIPCMHIYVHVNMASIGYFIGVCAFIRAFCNELKSFITNFDTEINTKKLSSTEIEQKVISVMKFHQDVCRFAGIYGFSIE